MNNPKDVFTVPDAAKYCAVDRGTMLRWVKSGKLKAYTTLGGHHRIRKEDLESFLIENNLYPLTENYLKKGKVLILDDDYIFQQDISQMLSTHHYFTEVADDGFDAGIKVKEFMPDLIILDLLMPGIDGFEVCKRIKNDSTKSHIKIIILTGRGIRNNKEKVMQAGADFFIEKPVQEAVLMKSIKELMST